MSTVNATVLTIEVLETTRAMFIELLQEAQRLEQSGDVAEANRLDQCAYALIHAGAEIEKLLQWEVGTP